MMATGIAQSGDWSAQQRGIPRKPIPFRTVNRKGRLGHDPALQKHHLLPLQLLKKQCFGAMFCHLGGSIGFDDFRHNGLLLPATDAATLRTGMPLHRGPHRRYNEMVIDRVGRIEAGWSAGCRTNEQRAGIEALDRLELLQAALRKRLLSERRRFVLNRKDPLGAGFDFTELDAMAEQLWQAS